DVVPITEDLTLAALGTIVRTSNQDHFPVLDSEGAFVGLLELAAVRAQMLDPAFARVLLVGTVMETELPTLTPDTPAHDALEAFKSSGRTALPVLDAAGRFVGLVLKSKLLDTYRRELLAQDLSIEG
ncbi:MAG TPA: CBS domain-containing protein, partial [Planctomycetes bacterium]|nr:CBS domain-containing protein [Planctomycetota bacterium]